MQRDITLQPRPRGFHLVTREVVGELAELAEIRAGLLHVHIQHTSASLTLNENASPEVRRDFETWFSAAVPESFGGWTHTLEGSDDMPAHIKAVAARPFGDGPRAQRPSTSRHVAGDLPVRAPRPRRPPNAHADAQRRIAGAAA